MNKDNEVSVTRPTVLEILKAEHGQLQIPLYQREYTWEETRILNLVNSLFEASKKPQDYYLGTLVVIRREIRHKKIWEIVDGQQRLTTLVLLYHSLGLLDQCPIVFENRPLATQFLDLFFQTNIVSPCHRALSEAVNLLRKWSESWEYNFMLDSFKKFLLGQCTHKIFLFHVELSEGTDVAAYFEVMNNRGLKLSAHEMLKARLMAILHRDSTPEKECFSDQWNKCADFSVPFKEAGADTDDNTFNGSKALIDFPTFLLITLSVAQRDDGISLERGLLLKTFEDRIKLGDDVIKFLNTLIVVRQFFDNAIIRSKPDEKEKKEARWVSPLAWSNIKSNPDVRHLVMLQSLLEVSTSERWLVHILKRHAEIGSNALAMRRALEEFIREYVSKLLIGKSEGIDVKEMAEDLPLEKGPVVLRSGLGTPRIIFHVLDYLFWGMGIEKDFVFRHSRNSIEHFYPRNDDDIMEDEKWGVASQWKESIGNLYLTSSEVNSSLSKSMPILKVQKYEEKRLQKTPKQSVMYETTKSNGTWTVEDCKKHAQECWELLADFLNESPESPSTPAASKDEPNTSGAGENGSAGE